MGHGGQLFFRSFLSTHMYQCPNTLSIIHYTTYYSLYNIIQHPSCTVYFFSLKNMFYCTSEHRELCSMIDNYYRYDIGDSWILARK